MQRVRDPLSYHAMSSYPSTLCFLGDGVSAADCVVLVVVWVRRCERGGVALCGGRWARARLGGGSCLACGGDSGTCGGREGVLDYVSAASGTPAPVLVSLLGGQGGLWLWWPRSALRGDGLGGSSRLRALVINHKN
jgi:hypothetical protein